MSSLPMPQRLAAERRGVARSPWLEMVVLAAAAGVVAAAVMLESAAVTSAVTGLWLALGATAAGAVGAKLWYAISHRLPPRALRQSGFCVQGFIVASVATATAEALLARLPAGAALNASAPALFLGLSIGRIGCIRAGCCAGRRLTEIEERRWAVLGVQHVPTQLLECLVCVAIVIVTALLPTLVGAHDSGAVMAGAVLVYAVSRRALLPLRARRTPGPRTAQP